MDKEEYIKKLEAQFGGETLIPEGKESVENEPTVQETHVEETNVNISVEKPDEEAQISTGDVPESPVGEVPSGKETEGEEPEEYEPEPPNGHQKFSNKKIKKTMWQNEQMAKKLDAQAKELEELKAQLQNLQKPKAETVKKPLRKDYASEEDFADANFAYHMRELAERNRKAQEEEMLAAREQAQLQKAFIDKVNNLIPEDKRDEYSKWMQETNMGDLDTVIDLDTQDEIISMSTAPIVFWKLGHDPELVSMVNRMNKFERMMFFNELGKTSPFAQETQKPTSKPVQKAPVMGKLGKGTMTNNDYNTMTDDELYQRALRKLSGQG